MRVRVKVRVRVRIKVRVRVGVKVCVRVRVLRQFTIVNRRRSSISKCLKTSKIPVFYLSPDLPSWHYNLHIKL